MYDLFSASLNNYGIMGFSPAYENRIKNVIVSTYVTDEQEIVTVDFVLICLSTCVSKRVLERNVL